MPVFVIFIEDASRSPPARSFWQRLAEAGPDKEKGQGRQRQGQAADKGRFSVDLGLGWAGPGLALAWGLVWGLVWGLAWAWLG